MVEGHSEQVDGHVTPDKTLESFLAPLEEQVAHHANRVVGNLSESLVRDRSGNSSMGNFVARAMRSGLVSQTGDDTDLCFTNMGGLRTDLPAGPVSAGALVELMPFDNTVVAFSTSGAEVIRILDRVHERGAAVVGKPEAVTEKMIDLDRSYRVCTNDYVFDGGGDYHLQQAASDVTRTGILLRDLIEDAVVSTSTREQVD